MGSRLSLVEKKINENTDLLSNPDATKDPSIKVLSSEVAKLGSTYQDLSGSVKSLKDTTSSLQSYQTTLKANITSISVCNSKKFFKYLNRIIYKFYFYQIGKIK